MTEGESAQPGTPKKGKVRKGLKKIKNKITNQNRRRESFSDLTELTDSKETGDGKALPRKILSFWWLGNGRSLVN